MKTIGVKELKSSLRETLDRVKVGEPVLVIDRGEPIARIVPVEPEEDRMAHLVRSGVLRPPLRPLDESFWTLPRPQDPEGLVLAELLRQRGSDR